MNLHIISFNVPYPPNYGGVIDVFYKIKALHKAGIKIHLHCYVYGRSRREELEKYAEHVYYYKRDTSVIKQFSIKPYIVHSRKSNKLLERLQRDDYPILFEGLHCCNFLDLPELANRKKIVRTHNIEHDYYQGLASQESNLFKKLFFKIEALRLRKFEPILKKATAIATISDTDLAYFNSKYGNSFLLPPFHSNDIVTSNTSQGTYMLYHGSLNVIENIEAALFLVDTFKQQKNLPLILAGRNPHKRIVSATNNIAQINIIDTPSPEEMSKLITNAQIIILPTFQPTGVKLKLLEALYNGKHIICNKNMTNGTNLTQLCNIAETKEDYIKIATKLYKTSITNTEINKRKNILSNYFDNRKNAEKFINNYL